MKNVFTMMEQSCHQDIKKVLQVYLLEAIVVTWLIFFKGLESWMYLVTLLAGLVGIVVLETRRIYHQCTDGSIHRLLLLPIKRSTFFWSEVIYCTSALLGVPMILYVLWILLAPMAVSLDAFTFLIYSWNNPAVSLLFPSNPIRILSWVLLLVAIAIQCVVMALSCGLKQGKYRHAIINAVFWSIIFVGDISDTGFYLTILFALAFVIEGIYEARSLLHIQKKVKT